jgi:hypothetical protein
MRDENDIEMDVRSAVHVYIPSRSIPSLEL